MSKLFTAILLLLVLIGTGGTLRAQAAAADEPAGDSVRPQIEVKSLSIGIQGSDTKDHGGKVSEFDVLDEGGRGQLGLELLGGSKNSRFWLLAAHKANVDQNYAADMRLGQWVRAQFDYSTFRHWLDHDPLTYGVEVQGLPPIRKIYKIDEDPGATYQVNRSLSNMGAQFRIPGASFLTAHTSLRTESRHGFQQAVSYDMCLTCHISSRERAVNQLVSDYSIGAAVTAGKATIDYTFSYRDFDDNHDAPMDYLGGPGWNPDTVLFETWPTHPAAHENKRFYNGSWQPYGLNPSHRKVAHIIDITQVVNPQLSLLLQGAYVSTENQYTGLEMTQGNGSLMATYSASPRLTVSGRYGYQRIDNDDLLTTKLATLNSLMDTSDTYYPTADNLINSALTRTTHDADVNGTYRLTNTTNLLLGLGYGSIDRDNFGTDATTEFRASIGVTTRPFKKGRLKVEYLAAFTENPYSNPRAGKEDPPDTSFINDIYSTFARIIREDPLAADPTDRHEVKVRLNGSLGTSVAYAIGGTWKSCVNDETEWESKTISPYLNLSYTTTTGSSVSAGYSYNRGRSKTLFSAPDMLLVGGQLQYHHGSFYQLIPYNDDAHTISLSGLAALSKRVSFNTSVTYTLAEAFYDTKDYIGVPFHDGATDTVDLRNLNQFSQHEYRQLWLNVGMEYNLWSNVYMSLNAGFNDFDNKKIYLYDMSGRAYALSAAISLREF